MLWRNRDVYVQILGTELTESLQVVMLTVRLPQPTLGEVKYASPALAAEATAGPAPSSSGHVEAGHSATKKPLSEVCLAQLCGMYCMLNLTDLLRQAQRDTLIEMIKRIPTGPKETLELQRLRRSRLKSFLIKAHKEGTVLPGFATMQKRIQEAIDRGTCVNAHCSSALMDF